MTSEEIEMFRQIVKPFMQRKLKEFNYEGQGQRDSDEFSEDFDEILGLAIRALESQSCTDAVNRQAVMDSLDGYFNIDGAKNAISVYRYLTAVRDRIKNLPSVHPERKKGKWIRITQGAMPEQYICPFCHRTVESYGVEELLSIRYPYCHCGADMREVTT